MASSSMSDTTAMGEKTKLVAVESMRRPVHVTVCTSSGKENVAGLITYLNRQPKVEADFKPLPYNVCDLKDKMILKGIDVMVLCHSIRNRRLSLTNVMDALYDEFLPMAKRELGKGKIIVVAHDFSSDKLQGTSYDNRMESVRAQQKLVFECASHLLLCANLSEDASTILTDNQEKDLSNFLREASELPENKQNEFCWRCMCCCPCFCAYCYYQQR